MKSLRNCLFRGLFFCCLTTLLWAPSAIAESITIAGTGDSQYLLSQLGKAFEQKNKNVQVLIPNSVGSGGGIKLLLAGRAELARIARPLKPKEQAEGLQNRIFAYSPVVFVANLPQSCLEGITATDFISILKGEISNWNHFAGCPDNKIYVANREDGDSSKTVLEQQIPEIKTIANPVGRTLYSTPEAYNTLNHYPYSFGYLPKSQIHQDNLTMLKFNGIEPSIENVQQQKYKLAVPLGIVWQATPSGPTKKFLDFLFSEEAQKIILNHGAIPAQSK